MFRILTQIAEITCRLLPCNNQLPPRGLRIASDTSADAVAVIEYEFPTVTHVVPNCLQF